MRRFLATTAILTALSLLLAMGYFFLPRQNFAEKKARANADPHIMVLNYHKVDNLDISLAVLPADFAAQMKYLAENNFHTIDIETFYAGLSGETQLPENPVLITFDDGYKDNYTNALPILKQYGLKATVFVISDFVGRKDYMTWDELREMRESGVSIQSHTATHASLTDLTDEQLKKELTESKQKIESEIKDEVNFIAYPTGAYNLHIAGLVKSAGYKAAFTVKYGNVDGHSNFYAVERVPVFHTENTMKSFRERMNYTPLFVGNGWKKN